MEITALTHEDSCPKQTVLPNKTDCFARLSYADNSTNSWKQHDYSMEIVLQSYLPLLLEVVKRGATSGLFLLMTMRWFML